MPSVLYLSPWPVSRAGLRLRGAQFDPGLRELGWSVQLWSFLSERAARRWISGRKPLALLALAEALLRLTLLVPRVLRADVVVVLREAVPMSSALVESLISRVRPVVWDVDDAIWERAESAFTPWMPDALRDRGRKARLLAAKASQIWPGSEVLAEWCRQHNDDVRLLPTVVAVPPTSAHPRRCSRDLVWIGSESTASFIAGILPALAGIPGIVVHVMGATLEAPDGLDVRCYPWSAEGEQRLLRTARLGLYPVDMKHPLAEGKCGLKAILYMGAGLPAVITPSATNASISRDELESLHAQTDEEWRSQVNRLLDDEALHARLSADARTRAQQSYSVAAWVPNIVSRLDELLVGNAS